MTNEELTKKVQELQEQIDALKNYATIPLDIGEAMKARIIGQNELVIGQTTSGTPATLVVTDNDGINPPTNYTVCAPFTKQLIIKLGEVTYVVPAN